jgi:2-desacetyl-2-hydroxyethyl bacteriochlorophyllide A dehydrogenase
MKAAVIVRAGAVEIQDVPRPKIGDYQVLVEQLTCGVCTGTDWKLVEGHFKGFDTYPAVLGHEAVGRVIAKGKKVRTFELGDLVVRPGLERIGDGTGLHSGWGGFAEYGVAGDAKAMIEDGLARPEDGFLDLYLSQQVIPRDMKAAHGTMLITFKEVLSAAYRAGFRPNASIMIFGLGPVGLSFTRFAKVLGLGPIVSVDRHESRRARAGQLGADVTLDPRSEDPVAWMKEHCPGGFDFVVDAVGLADLINRAMELVAFNGTICVYGVAPQTSMHIDWTKAPYNWNLSFLQWPTFQEESATHRQLLGWIRHGIVEPDTFITHVLPLVRLWEGMQMLRERRAFKVVIDLKAR